MFKFFLVFTRNGCKYNSLFLSVEGLMNSAYHCFQSCISLTEQGLGWGGGWKIAKEASSKWKHHHSFPVKRKPVLPMAPQGQAGVLQLAAAARGGVPTAGQCRLLSAVHSRQTLHIPCAEHEVRVFWSHLMPLLPVWLHLIHLGYRDTTIIPPSHMLGPAGVIPDLGSASDGSSYTQKRHGDRNKYTVTPAPQCIQYFKLVSLLPCFLGF